jgi:indolepyruvate ferredoxin oxidoreductase
VLKIGCPWPIGRDVLEEFAAGLDLIMVVEEKRSLIEVQVREELYGSPHQPVVIGKKDEKGQWLFPAWRARPERHRAGARPERLLRYHEDAELAARLAAIGAVQGKLAEVQEHAKRTPYFCSGCPHNSSTVVPEASRAYAGIGCHYMVQWMDREHRWLHPDGREGRQLDWRGPFSKTRPCLPESGRRHLHPFGFAGDPLGGRLQGQHHLQDALQRCGGDDRRAAARGRAQPWQMAQQIAAEGVERIAVVSDEPDKYPSGIQWPAATPSTTATTSKACSASWPRCRASRCCSTTRPAPTEKRRRRKRGDYPDPDKRVIINELVCEGCGDCGVKSNCVSVQPLETEFGRKRQIDQSNCNKDFSCVNGFCPSFVTVEGAQPKKADVPKADAGALGDGALPEPVVPALTANYAIIVTGVGGTGVVTIGAILGMAAHLEGKGCGMIDMAGLAQKGGAVFSHVRLAPTPEDIHAIRVAAGQADLVLGCDLIVTGSKKVLAAVRKDDTTVLCNTAEFLPGDFTRNADFSLPSERIKRAVLSATGREHTHFIDATGAAMALLGNAIAANMFIMGYAWQLGPDAAGPRRAGARHHAEWRGRCHEPEGLRAGPAGGA